MPEMCMNQNCTTPYCPGCKDVPREYTIEEARDKFLAHIAVMVDYWAKTPGPELNRLEGIAFSILVALDGGAVALPGFKVTPGPHPADKAYCISQGENYWPRAGDIAGELHERFHDALRKHRGEPTKEVEAG